MNRPPRPRMMNNFQRSPIPHNYQWRPNRAPSPRCSGNNSHFGSLGMRAENGEKHWCETCDREFPTADLLHKHKQQHQKCNIDGCQFIAHPKVITKHIQMQHSTGLYKKIANLNNPEDIQKWREERKKKYPTKLNIEKKAAERQEKIERGEKMAMNHDYRNDKRRSTAQGPNLKRQHNFDKRNQNPNATRPNNKSNCSISTNNQPAKKIPRVIPKAPATAEKNKLKPFAGIVNIEIEQDADDTAEPLESNNGLIEDDDEGTLVNPKDSTNDQKPVLCGALTSLMCDYGSTDEETEEKENEMLNKSTITHNKKVEPARSENNKTTNMVDTPVEDKSKLMEKKESDDEGPEEVKILKNDIEHDTAPETVTKTKETPSKNIMPPRKPERQNYKLNRKIPSTLLQKLLHTEIRKERNIVLQCIRYIKRCNYFEKPSQ